jgi:hypothetical protein
MADRFLNGESNSIATMPMLKICTPPPDMYNMNACMGSDLTGEMAKSHARFCFSASWEFRVATAVAEDLLDSLVYKMGQRRRTCVSVYPHGKALDVRTRSIAPSKFPRNLAEEEACSIYNQVNGFFKGKRKCYRP